jgi:serine/threonine protein phosphatase 1
VASHFAIGDIHGCSRSLRSLIDYVAPAADDVIVTLGDYVDRGPDSRAVLDFIIDLGRQYQLVPLRGNHEIMMLDAAEKSSWLVPWLKYGGEQTLLSYSPDMESAGSFADIPQAHMDFLRNELVPWFECDAHFFVHANADADVPLNQQSDATLYWRKYKDPIPHCSGKIMVCGHSAQRSGLPLSNGHSICIDTWAHGDGWLSCLEVESGTVWQTNEAGERRHFSLDEIANLAGSKTDRRN